ncbi:MAG TPA: hypothetical protein VGQ14_03395 [Candidatus Eisenbacteria bacterium]|nr:hypothetical protein [Candidatus Eisenbacteria bacterium]
MTQETERRFHALLEGGASESFCVLRCPTCLFTSASEAAQSGDHISDSLVCFFSLVPFRGLRACPDGGMS